MVSTIMATTLAGMTMLPKGLHRDECVGLPLKYRFGVTGHHHDHRAVLHGGVSGKSPSWVPVVGRR